MILKLQKYGIILTGRPFGKKVMEELAPTLKIPVTIDFEGTVSMGSSFGDEIIPVIAKMQDGEVSVINANKVVWSCLARLAEDHHITIREASK